MIIISFGFPLPPFYIYQIFIFLSELSVKILLPNKKLFYITFTKIQIAYNNYMQAKFQ